MLFRNIKTILQLSITLSIPFIQGCGLIFGGDQKVDTKSKDYDYLRLDKKDDWTVLQENFSEKPGEQGDIAFEHKTSGAIISMNSVCSGVKEVKLESLTKNLLMGLQSTSSSETKKIKISGINALETTLLAIPSDDPARKTVKIRATVLHYNGCSFDLMYIAQPELFSAHISDYEEFLNGFHIR